MIIIKKILLRKSSVIHRISLSFHTGLNLGANFTFHTSIKNPCQHLAFQLTDLFAKLCLISGSISAFEVSN